MMMFGWISAIAFGICGLPQAIKSYRDGHSMGVSHGLIILWLIGELAGIVYAIHLMATPLIFNYIFNTIFVGVILRYKYFAREKKCRDLEKEVLTTCWTSILNFKRYFMK